MGEKIKVCAYCRVSTDMEEQKTSFRNQKLDFDEYFKNNEEYELIKTYADEGLSGTSLNKRKQFVEMLIDCGLEVINVENTTKTKMKMTVIASDRLPEYKYIFVSNTSRFGRNIVQVTDIIRELKGKGVYVIFKDRGLSTENERDMQFLPHMFYFDELESIDKSHKVRAGYVKSANNTDTIHANRNFFGFVFDRSNNRLVKHKDEAEVVKKIFELYANGVGIRRILNFLSDNGYKTRNGKDFGKTTINKILQNEKYAGINVRLKYDTGEVLIDKHHPKLKPKNEWVINKSDKIEAIISEDLFNQCQEIRNSKINTISQRGIYRRVSEYSGKLICAICGSTLTRNSDRGRVFYNCSLKKTKGVKACWNDNISLKDLEAEIDAYRNHGFKEDIYHAKSSGLAQLEDFERHLLSRIDVKTEKQIEEKKEEVVQYKNVIEKYARIFGLGKMDEEMYIKLSDEENNKIKRLEEQIRELSKSNEEIIRDIQKVNEAMKHLLQIEEKDEYSKQDILEEVKSFIIFPSAMSTTSGRINFMTKNKEFIYGLVNRIG